ATLESALQNIDPATLGAEIGQLAESIEQELEPRQKQLFERSGREQKELELMDGNDQAAALAEQAAEKITVIEQQAREYISLKLAARVLRDEIERFRKKHQGPMLSRASEYFASLTLGSFVALDTDIDDKDQPVLIALRANAERVGVEGMSSGTRDQLYLALRLAAIDQFIDNRHRMPFIVDDVLIEFDDQRTMAALELFSAFAEKTQVVLFTHHQRLVELAEGLQKPAVFHRL
ncbi:MAG: chromosome segregation protein SMC, partial [Gammaproteobacteria bacterium]|nr:chromosome segregation protein SMC [Gammaproteobacteria bacterium]